MVFTSKVFIFLFIPLCAFLYYVLNQAEKWKITRNVVKRLRIKDCVFILLSILFYGWSGHIGLIELSVFVLAVYAAGWFISKRTQKVSGNEQSGKVSAARKNVLLLSIGVIVAALVLFKYPYYLSKLCGFVSGTDVPETSIIAPIGISFITFSAISYLTDIYRGHATAGSLIDGALYLMFFPKVISGPIVLWKDFQPQIFVRSSSLDLTVTGLNRIICGMAKKAILADTFGAYLADFSANPMDRITAFTALIIYALQLYYDFSGYSDVAIGLSNLFGFQFKANFNFPYRSKSISEFWRRWHISLGTWFREYVYFPLGGSRCSQARTAFNLAVVFALTGIWHGTGLNYLLWGLINGAFVIAEHYWQHQSFYKKIPNAVKYICTMTIVVLFWQLFYYNNLADVGRNMGTILGFVQPGELVYTWKYNIDARLIVLIIVGILGATVLGSPKLTAYYKKISANPVVFVVQEIGLLLLFVLSILFIVNSTYSPFIYFQY